MKPRICSAALALAAIAAAAGGAVQDRQPAQPAGRLADRLRARRATAPEGLEQSIKLAGLDVAMWLPAQAPGAKAPLVVFSHGFGGINTQSSALMRALAQHGYLVAAPNHRDARKSRSSGPPNARPQVSFATPDAWTDTTYTDRRADVCAVLDALKTEPKWSSRIDWSKVALAGHSLGGYTALGVAGAWPKWRRPEIKAVLALSPWCAPYVRKATLSALKVPIMYQGGTRDFAISPSVSRPGGAYDQTRAPVVFVEFTDAGHLAWTDLATDHRASIAYYSIAFLDRYLKADRTADPTRRLADVALLRAK